VIQYLVTNFISAGCGKNMSRFLFPDINSQLFRKIRIIAAAVAGGKHGARRQIGENGWQEAREAQPLLRENGGNTGAICCCANFATAATKARKRKAYPREAEKQRFRAGRIKAQHNDSKTRQHIAGF
jgi:hypothetical protein